MERGKLIKRSMITTCEALSRPQASYPLVTILYSLDGGYLRAVEDGMVARPQLTQWSLLVDPDSHASSPCW